MSNYPDAADDPRDVATLRYNATLIQSLDDQIQGLALDVVPRRNAPYVVAWPKADPDAAALVVGTAVALKGASSSEQLMVACTSANVAAGALYFGVLTVTTSPGLCGPVAVAGALPTSITGLSAAGVVRANSTTGALEIATVVAGTDTLVGRARTDGTLVLFGAASELQTGVRSTSFEADADEVVSDSARILRVAADVALTAVRKLVLPLTVAGAEWVIDTAIDDTDMPGYAASSGQFFIRVGGATGGYALVPSDGVARVYTDGTNFYAVGRPSTPLRAAIAVTGSATLDTDRAVCDVLSVVPNANGYTLTWPSSAPMRTRHVVNPTAFSISIKGQTGSAITIAAGKSAIVSGTGAVLLGGTLA